MKKYFISLLIVFIIVLTSFFIRNYGIIFGFKIENELRLFIGEFIQENYDINFKKCSPSIKLFYIVKKGKRFIYKDDKLEIEFLIDPLKNRIASFNIKSNKLEESKKFKEYNKIIDNISKTLKKRIKYFDDFEVITSENTIILRSHLRINGYKVYYWVESRFEIILDKKNYQIKKIRLDPVYENEFITLKILEDHELFDKIKRTRRFKKRFGKSKDVIFKFSKDSNFDVLVSKDKYFYYADWSFGIYSPWLHKTEFFRLKTKPILCSEIHIIDMERICASYNQCIINAETGKIIMWY